MVHGAAAAAPVRGRGRQSFLHHDGLDVLGAGSDSLAQCRADDDAVTSPAGGGEDRALADRGLEHLLQAHGLAGELDLRGASWLVVAGLVLDGDDPAVVVDLDYVTDPGQAKSVAPDRERPQRADPRSHLLTGFMDALVQHGSTDGCRIVGVAVFKEDQAGLPGTVVMMLQGGQRHLGQARLVPGLARRVSAHPWMTVSVTPAGNSLSPGSSIL